MSESTLESPEGVSGFFGKLPLVGDFVSRRIPEEALKVWDNWLQAGLEASQTQLGVDWLENYLSCPVWRFVFQAGVVESACWAGIMSPSCDRVGRYFPQTVIHRLSPSTLYCAVAANHADWFDEAESIALLALDEGYSNIDEFDSAVCNLKMDESPVELWCQPTRSDASGKPLLDLPLSSGDSIGSLAPIFTEHLSLFYQHCSSLWWTEGGEEANGRCLLFSGLPPANEFSRLLVSTHGASAPVLTRSVADAGPVGAT